MTSFTYLARIYTASIGLLVDGAKTLKDGNAVADKETREMIASEVRNIKKPLDDGGLLISLDHFERGIVSLNQVFDKTLKGRKLFEKTHVEDIAEDRLNTSSQGASFDNLVENFPLTAKQSLRDSKYSFDEACKIATEVFNDESRKTSDRILALKIRLVAIILKHLDRPAFTSDETKLCLEELHAMPEVRESFEVELSDPEVTNKMTNDESNSRQSEREAIFVDVYEVNSVVFRAMLVKGEKIGTITLPLLKTESGVHVDVLTNEKVGYKLRELKDQHNIATNEQITVASTVSEPTSTWNWVRNAGSTVLGALNRAGDVLHNWTSGE